MDPSQSVADPSQSVSSLSKVLRIRHNKRRSFFFLENFREGRCGGEVGGGGGGVYGASDATILLCICCFVWGRGSGYLDCAAVGTGEAPAAPREDDAADRRVLRTEGLRAIVWDCCLWDRRLASSGLSFGLSFMNRLRNVLPLNAQSDSSTIRFTLGTHAFGKFSCINISRGRIRYSASAFPSGCTLSSIGTGAFHWIPDASWLYIRRQNIAYPYIEIHVT